VTNSIIRSIVNTADGSSTLYVPILDEHYHSVHGAVQESSHVFLDAGWRAIAPGRTDLKVLEIGFGTGLNAWLTAKEAENQGVKTYYESLEAYPLSLEEAGLLNYTEGYSDAERQIFLSMHESPWGVSVEIQPGFSLKKWHGKLEDWMPDATFDLIYFDAFAPSAQPELWTEEVFKKLRSAAREGALLVTYCAKGSVKRAMKASGWKVEALPGPPGKREMTRCTAV
jgi:tRNA U34 5-methylaminomethyl-2-thiouridine-forming methyltransferase MnmC